MNKLYRSIVLILGLIFIWQLLVKLCCLPNYLLPTPYAVFSMAWQNHKLLLQALIPTFIETISSFLFGIVSGVLAAVVIVNIKALRLWFLPLLILSQALPTFAIAPLFVIWFGYGLASKIAVGTLMVFFPVTSTFYDGLRLVPNEWLDLAHTMQASRLRIFWHIQLPAALPSLASGMRIAAVVAPAAAIVGEWVGASRGLGFLMLNANARMQIDLMFAALLLIIALTLVLYFTTDKLLQKLIWW